MSGEVEGGADRWSELIRDFRQGRRRALARAISIVEGGRPGAHALLGALLNRPPSARRIGVTGPPGAGKSSLVAGLVTRLREQGQEVAVVAVDPTSPYSGGALLGDRIRMNDLSTDPGVFIRSMATRGSLGGLAAKTKEVIDLMDAFGFPRVIVETVGVGQTELEITTAADSVAVVLVPESGDSVQAMKAGLMEIADLFVVNKADRPGADRLMRDLTQALHLRAGRAMAGVPAHHGVDLRAAGASRPGGVSASPALPEPDATPEDDAVPASDRIQAPSSPGPESGGSSMHWETRVLKTSAGRGQGLEDFQSALDAHYEHLVSSGELDVRRRARALDRIKDVLQRRMTAWGKRVLDGEPDVDGWVARVVAGEITPYDVVDRLLEAILEGDGPPAG